MIRCKHCGLEFDDDGLMPEHDWYPLNTVGVRCPGSGRDSSGRKPGSRTPDFEPRDRGRVYR